MINYSISLRANPSDQDAPKKAYANAQYSEIMTLDKFAEHISTHGSKYNRADIQAVLIQAVDCMREQLLAGQRIQMGDLGTFSIHINSMGAESLETYNPAIPCERPERALESRDPFPQLAERQRIQPGPYPKGCQAGG